MLLGNIEAMDGQPYLMLQRAYEYTPEDVRLGQAQPYIEICNQGWSWYGQIDRVELHATAVKVRMSEKARALMENDGQFRFEIENAPSRVKEIAAALERIFEGKACYARLGV